MIIEFNEIRMWDLKSYNIFSFVKKKKKNRVIYFEESKKLWLKEKKFIKIIDVVKNLFIYFSSG